MNVTHTFPTVAIALTCVLAAAGGGEPIRIGSRLEPLVDEYLLETIGGGARLELHRPARRNIVFKTDAPWEGNASSFQSVFQDGPRYRMYYRGLHYANGGRAAMALKTHPWLLCYAESDDGVHWRRPKLGIFEFNGSKANNILLTPEFLSEIGGDPAHTATFKDANPDCPADARYKIVVVGSKPRGLYLLKSADGLHFSLMSKRPFCTQGDFDSQNLAFWDPVRREYREYHRQGRGETRDIMTSAAQTWDAFPKPQFLAYPAAPKEQLYTNQVQPYYRAPHIFMGFPMRYQERGWNDSVFELPGKEERLTRGEGHPRYGMAITDAVFMTSRDGVTFKRWPEAFIRPGPRQRQSWVYGDNFVFWGMVETRSDLEDAPDEISLYATESYWEGTSTSIRRYTLRVDGFVSVAAPLAGGQIVTKPLVFDGGNLALNFETSGAGSIRVEVQEVSGKPVEGFTLADCEDIVGDRTRHVVRWKARGGDLRPLAGKAVRLRFALRDADLYSLQFVPYQPDPTRPDISRFGAPKLPKKTGTRQPFVVLDDDFRSGRAGTSPIPDDLNPSGKPWLIQEGAVDRVQILNDQPVGSGRSGVNRYLKIERRDENHLGGGLAWIRLALQDAAETENGQVEIQTRVYLPSSNKSAVQIDAYDNLPPWGCDRRAFQLRLLPNGSVCYYRQRNIPVPGLRIQTDVWQDIVILAHMKRAEFDVTLAGKTVKGLPFADDDRHRLITICLGPNSNNATLCVERVQVKVSP